MTFLTTRTHTSHSPMGEQDGVGKGGGGGGGVLSVHENSQRCVHLIKVKPLSVYLFHLLSQYIYF